LRTVSWIAREHATTTLPAPSSLKALRRIARPSSAPLPMIGFGNPLLDGPDSRYAELAKRARDTQRCPDRRLLRRSGEVAALQRGVETVATRDGFADLERLKHQTPLPETADELCAVARDVKADTRDLRLGARATEHEVKTLSTRGDLMRYRIVHFATHGTLANQLMGASEPGLILTPPGQATDNDDGYLSASEIAGLRLDADWVILSACNTAAGSGGRSEALSGLAQAFIYAGARALLVSHWAVDSDAAVKLVTAAVREMARNPRVGRGEALRRAALALIDTGAGHEAHPAFWAPFVVVGEGAAQQ
jgi:CHAT domain-containing protein